MAVAMPSHSHVEGVPLSIRTTRKSEDRLVDERHIDQSLTALTSSDSRRGTFRSLAAIGTALIAGIGGSATAAKSRNDGGVRREKKRKVKKGPAGAVGPA